MSDCEHEIAIEDSTIDPLPERMVCADCADAEIAHLACALGRAIDLIRDLRPYAEQSWDWKYGEGWREEEAEIAWNYALALARRERGRVGRPGWTTHRRGA